MLTKENGFTLPWRLPIRFDRKAAFAMVTLFVTLLLIYSNSFQGEWHFDDFHTIVDNPNIRTLSPRWPAEKPLAVRGPWFDRLDATDAVRAHWAAVPLMRHLAALIKAAM